MEGKAQGTRLVEFDKLGSLSRRRKRQWELQKSNRLGQQNNKYAPASPAFFVHLFAVTTRHDVKMPNFTTLFLFRNYYSMFQNWTPEEFANIWHIERDKKKREKVRCSVYLLSLSDVFVAVAVNCRRCCLNSLISWHNSFVRTKLSTKLIKNTCLFQTFGWNWAV